MYSFFQCLKYSLHIGHTIKNSNILAAWILFRIRNNIWIINIFKTVIFLKLIFKFLKYIVYYNFPFWFINLDILKSGLFSKYANYCGEYACVKNWVRGYLSNFRSIQYSLISYLIKKHAAKSIAKEHLLQNWMYTRYTWPRGIFISNLDHNYICLREISQMSLPVVGVVDSNIKTFLYHYPIPANDDSLESLCFILSLISKIILLIKYKKIILWYLCFKIRSKKKSYLYLKLKKKNILNFKILNTLLLNNMSVFNSNLRKLFKLKIKKLEIYKDSIYINTQNNKIINLLLFMKLKNIRKFRDYINFFRVRRYYLRLRKNWKYSLKWMKFFDKSKRIKKIFYLRSARLFFSFYIFLFKSIYNIYENFIDSNLKHMSDAFNILQESKEKAKLVFQKYGVKWKFLYVYKLIPLIKKFTLKNFKFKRGKKNFYNPDFFFKRLNKFYFFFLWKKKKFSFFSYKYYLKWFFLLSKKKMKTYVKKRFRRYNF